MQKTMKAVTTVGQGKVEVREYPIEPLHPRDARVKVNMNAICGSDVHWLFDEKGPIHKHFGHERVGTLIEMGDEFIRVDLNGEPLKLGDRITWAPPSCGKCYNCLTLESDFACLGWPEGYPRPTRPRPADYGGMAEYEPIPEGSYVYKMPDDMPDEVAVLADPLSIALYAIERAYQPGLPSNWRGLGPGQTVIVQGSGAIGLLIATLAKLVGAYKVIVIGGPDDGRLGMCREFGTDMTINVFETTAEERLEMIRGMTPYGVGPDVVFEAAGVPAAFAEGINLVRHSGTYVEVGCFSFRGTVEIDPNVLLRKNINLLGSYIYNRPSTLGKAVRMLEAFGDRVPWAKVVTHRFPLDQAQEAFGVARRQEGMRVVVVPQ